MVAFNILSLLTLAAGALAQGQFGQPENSAAVLAQLRIVNRDTITSGRAARAYKVGDQATNTTLVNANIQLRADWQSVLFIAQKASGFYTTQGANNIINYVKGTLYNSTAAADQIYLAKRDDFVRGGFIDFINEGLLELRAAVDGASSAVQAKTPASLLTPMTMAFTLIEQDYATTQEKQFFGN